MGRCRLRTLALLTFVCLAFPLCARAASVHGGIFITSLPSGAAVWMDGVYLGETPLFAESIDSGRHTLTLTRSGWTPQSAHTDVAAGHVSTVSLVLASNNGARPQSLRVKGYLVVRAAAGSRVSLDGSQLQTPDEMQPVNAGDHILTVEKPGSPRITQVVRIYALVTTVVALTAAPPTNATASSDDQVLALLDLYVPPSNFSMNGEDITIHYRGVEVECAIGSKAYTFNGKPGLLDVAPVTVGKKAYLPLSLLKRIVGAAKTAAR